MYDAADFIVSRFTEDGLNGLIQNAVSGFGNYDLKNKIYLGQHNRFN